MRNRQIHIGLLFWLLMQTIALAGTGAPSAVKVIVNPQIQYQIIEGFGASDCWSFQKIGEWHEELKNHIADLLFSRAKGIGLSQWRFNIGAGINRSSISHPWRSAETFEIGPGQYDWNRQAEERWFLEAARARGVEQFIAFVNSPPGRMNRNGLTNCTNGQGTTNLKDGWEDQFARYLKDILLHFRDEWNLEFDFISPVNEPQWEWNSSSNQEGNRASNEDIRQITIALYDTLQSAGLQTGVLLVESGDLRSWYQYNSDMSSEYGKAFGNYLSEVIHHDDLKDRISKKIAGHSYWSDRIHTQLVQDRETLAGHIRPYLEDGWRYWVTEYTILDGPTGNGGRGRDLTMRTAIDVVRIIHHDLTLLNASAWQWWTAVSPEDFKDGLIYTDYMNNPAEQSVIESKLLWAFGNFSRFIRPGYRRVEMLGAHDRLGLMGSAYLAEERDTLVMVFINASAMDMEISLEISDLGFSKSLRGYLTSDAAADDLRDVGLLSLDGVIAIPSLSVLTLVATADRARVPFHGYDPHKYQLFQNYPNPFHNRTKLCFHMPESGTAELSIYAVTGKLIHSVRWQHTGSGINYYTWDGHDRNQEGVATGMYVYTLRAGDQLHARKMLHIQ